MNGKSWRPRPRIRDDVLSVEVLIKLQLLLTLWVINSTLAVKFRRVLHMLIVTDL